MNEYVTRRYVDGKLVTESDELMEQGHWSVKPETVAKALNFHLRQYPSARAFGQAIGVDSGNISSQRLGKIPVSRRVAEAIGFICTRQKSQGKNYGRRNLYWLPKTAGQRLSL